MSVRNYLGIDYGHARIGLALGESETKIARPLITLEKHRDPLSEIKTLISEHQIEDIILGLPRTLNGQDSIQTAAVRAFAVELAELGRPIHLQDEAATTALAKERLANRQHSKADIDMEAAAIILQDYLNNL